MKRCRFQLVIRKEGKKMKEDGKGKTFSGISRRQFLGAGAGVAGGVIVGDQLFPRELLGQLGFPSHGIRK
jgi:hypothetical protein